MNYPDYQLERVNRCPIDIYVASNMPYNYPYKLGKPEHATPKIRDSCTTWIMDSGIGDDVSNAEVIELAEKYDADFVVPKDYLHDRVRTTQSVSEFMELYDESDIRATPLIPLQPPHDEHYKSLSEYSHYMIGGMAFDYSAREQVEFLHRFRQAAGSEPYAHALGVGGSMDVVRALANNPNLVQSVDCSTPEQAAMNGAVIDAELKQTDIEIMTGDGSSRGRYALGETNAYQLCDAYTNASRNTECLSGWL